MVVVTALNHRKLRGGRRNSLLSCCSDATQSCKHLLTVLAVFLVATEESILWTYVLSAYVWDRCLLTQSTQGNAEVTEQHETNEKNDVKHSLLAGISKKISKEGPDSLQVVEKATKNGNVEVCMVTSVLHLRATRE